VTAAVAREVVLTTRSPEETRAAGRAVAALLEPGDVLVLDGQLGAGKTVFAKGVADGLGVTETVVSPTFTLAREYQGRLRLVHVDVYRLDHVQEFLDLGLDDLVGDDAVTLVEWGEAVTAELPADHLEVRLDPDVAATGAGRDDPESDEERALTIRFRGPTWLRRLDAVRAALTGGA
jgi:tRNA threonylcarbamoyladenosine biosynthesis protein TsaE